MEPEHSPGGCDTCDTKLAKPGAEPTFSAGQLRFLAAYRERVQIAPAARLAGVARCTAHRWAKDPVFAAAMSLMASAYFEAHRQKVLAAEDQREQWRRQRERDRQPERRATLERNAGYTWGSSQSPSG